MSALPVQKTGDYQPVPPEWRGTIVQIVEVFSRGDYRLAAGIAGVRSVPDDLAGSVEANLRAYGDPLVSLPEEAWATSVCIWSQDHWDVMVDLFTESEGASDLVLQLFVHEEVDGHTFKVHLVYVP